MGLKIALKGKGKDIKLILNFLLLLQYGDIKIRHLNIKGDVSLWK